MTTHEGPFFPTDKVAAVTGGAKGVGAARISGSPQIQLAKFCGGGETN